MMKRAEAREVKPSLLDWFRAIFFHVPDDVDLVVWSGRALALVIFALWGLAFMSHSVESNYVAQSFLHNVNLVFHEAGHIIFRPFGKFMMVLGGSLMQVLMPAVVMAAFLLKNRDAFGASVGLWWVGQNFMDLAPYINDARDLNLVLLGGVTGKDIAEGHDWEYLLGKLHLLTRDHALARFSHLFGIILMLTALAWGGYMLYRQFRVARSPVRS